VGVEADEAVIRVDGDPIADFRALEPLQAVLELIGEDVAHRDEPRLGGGAQRVDGGSRAAAAAADQPDLQLPVATDVHTRGARERGEARGRGDGAGTLDELAAGE